MASTREQLKGEERMFDSLLTGISLRLLRGGTAGVDNAIQQAVQDIGEHYGIDRVVLRKIDSTSGSATTLFWWKSSGDIGMSAEVGADEIPWISAQILKHDVVRVGKQLGASPEAIPDLEVLKRENVASLLVAPLVTEGELFGTLACGSRDARDWSDRTVREIKVLGELLAVNYLNAQRYNRLQMSEARFRTVVENQTEFIVRWLPDGTRTWVNDHYCKYWGKSREELVGESFLPLLHKEDRDRLPQTLNMMTPENPTHTHILRARLPSGQFGSQEWTDKGLFDNTGKLIEVQSIGRDITELRRAEHALVESEVRYRGFIENSSDWIWTMNLDFQHTYSNRRVEHILGYTPDEFTAIPFEEIVHPKDLVEIGERVPQLIEQKAGWNGWVIRFRHKNGSYRSVESSATPVFDSDGDLCGFRGVDRDVTFRELLTDISSDLLQADLDNYDEKIKQAFVRIASSYEIDRASIFWRDSRTGQIHRTHHWSREKGPDWTLEQNVRDVAPWCLQQILAGKELIIETPDQFPPEATVDRAFFHSAGVKSILAVPLTVDNTAVGAASFSTTRERTWSNSVVGDLKILSETLAIAFARATSMQTIARHQRVLSRSEHLAQVGSYSFVPHRIEGGRLQVTELKCSQGLYELLDLRPKEMSYEAFVSRVHPDDLDLIRESERAIFDDMSSRLDEYRILRSDGEVRYLLDHVEVDRDSAGHPVQVFGSMQDVTERVLREDKLRQALTENEKLRDQLQRENLYLREEVRAAHGFEQIVGESAIMQKVVATASKVGSTDIAVLILGETGTGKELVAHAVHGVSERRDKALISVNCAALSGELVDSELFGHEKGAFTGAHSQRKGRFELADGGTLFLDEVAELPPETQAKLLRVLQTGEFERLGGAKKLHSDVRLIAATNKDLKSAVDRGEFRADLFYRIASFPIEVPPLRERPDDIPVLAEHFVRKYSKRMGKKTESISARMQQDLVHREWPGNVRELESHIQRAMISASGPILDFAEPTLKWAKGLESWRRPSSSDATELRDVERQHILGVLERANWVIDGTRGAAAALDIPPSTLRSRMKRLGIKRPA